MRADRNNNGPGTLLFLRNFLKHPTMLGDPLPSSRFLVNRVLDGVPWERVRVMGEYGPGAGTFTEPILERLHPQGRLLAIETNPDFVRHLETRVQDERFQVVADSAADVGTVLAERGIDQLDCVVSGVPFKPIPDEARRRLVEATRSALHDEGSFHVYQFWRAALPYLRASFREVKEEMEFRNHLPMRIFTCKP